MITKKRIQTAVSCLCFLPMVFATTGCNSDNPVDGTADQDHAEAFGLVIYNSGTEIVRLEKGVITGEIEVGHEKETSLLTVRFLSEDGQTFTPDDDLKLSMQLANDSVAEIEAHAEDGAWSFHVVGLSEGETTLTIQLLHGDHADFVSSPLPVHVVEDGPGQDAHDEDHDSHDHDD